MKTLNILWQRLVTPEGETCERCGGTYDAIVQALPNDYNEMMDEYNPETGLY